MTRLPGNIEKDIERLYGNRRPHRPTKRHAMNEWASIFSGDEESAGECTHLIFRGYHSMYPKKGGFEVREGMRLLERKSCRCEACLAIRDNIHEDIQHEIAIDIVPQSIQDGRLYRLVFLPGCPDFETGIIEDWTLRFELVERETK